MPIRRAAVAVLAVSLALLPGCGDDDPPTSPQPPPPPATPTLENLWPAVGGNRWGFGLSMRSWSDAFYGWSDPDSVPPAPSVEAALAMSATWPPHVPLATDTTHYGMRFAHDGTHLHLSDSLGVPIAPRATARRFARSGFEFELLPVFLKPGRWSGIFFNGGVRMTGLDVPPWIYLEEPLTAGNTFSDIEVGSGATRSARNLGTVSVVTAFGTFDNAIEYAYVMDYGVQQVVTPQGTRYLRPWDFGRLVFVPQLGPVSLYERLDLEAGDTTGRSSGERRLRLLDRTVTQTAALSAAAASASR